MSHTTGASRQLADVVDMEMGEGSNDPLEQYLNPEYYDQSLDYKLFLNEDPHLLMPGSNNPTLFDGFSSPKAFSSPLPHARPFVNTQLKHSLSTRSSESPAASSQDSSSDSGSKRMSSSASSQSALTNGDVKMSGETESNTWNRDDCAMGGNGTQRNTGYEGTARSQRDSGSSNADLDNYFDLTGASDESASFRIKPESVQSPGTFTVKSDIHNTNSLMKWPTASSSSMGDSPPDVNMFESSPSAQFVNSPSPRGANDMLNGRMMKGGFSNAPWPVGHPHSQTFMPAAPYSMPQQATGPRMAPNGFPLQFNEKPRLILHPTPLKSRVETQIPIKMTLTSLPPGIKKLHLPTYTISKPKLLAKPTPERSPDTLELYTTLVCTSAMQNAENRKRAFERAATQDSAQESVPENDDDEESKPLNGGDVRICKGCIAREQKRAARKKVRKAEEEESWHRYEAKRVVVFNTHEVKDWQTPTCQPPSESTGEAPEPYIPFGSMQVDAPMRIACYCRHHNEKMGFQVIFTVKDYQDRLIAQEMTSPIMITDDHKTHNLPSVPTSMSNGYDGQSFPGATSGSCEGGFDTSSGTGLAPVRHSQSTPDLQALGNFNNFQMSFQHPSHTSSSTMTPRNLSRQTSPSTTLGPTSKKRKASGSSKVPSGLSMTKLSTTDTNTSAVPSSATSPFTPPYQAESSFGPTYNFGVQASNHGLPSSYHEPPFAPTSTRSHSVEQSFTPQYSAPNSAHPSRAPSPNGLRASMQAHHQAAVLQSVANALHSPTLPPPGPPTIRRIIPNEGPRCGGIEVTCLGSGFVPGLEVMFGNEKAITNTFWGDTSLVCLVPPSASAGTVLVTFKHEYQQQHIPQYPPQVPKQPVKFTYVDDDQQQLIRTALSVVGHKFTGSVEDVHELARRLIAGSPPSQGSPPGNSHSGAAGGTSFNSAAFALDLEPTLLKCLDVIDLHVSPHTPRLNLRRASGHTMLHLACSLGLNRFVAALLARGANPEPRDKGGFTPMHFAALHNHPQIVRRLMLSGADPTIRSLQGYTPSDMARSEEVYIATRRYEHHTRTRSASSLWSRTSSATSLRSVWEPASIPASVENLALSDDGDADNNRNEYEDEDANVTDDSIFWMRSRKPSAQKSRSGSVAFQKDVVLEIPDIAATGGHVSPSAAMIAFRDQLAAQIQHLQNTVHLNLPQMPTLPILPTLPDYQAYLPTNPMVRRISNLVGSKSEGTPKEQDYRWWDLFSSNVTAAPPAYEDIFPEGDVDTKRTSVAQAAADTIADNKCAEIFDQTENQAESSTAAVRRKAVLLDTVRIGQKHTITREQQDQLRLAHAEKLKRLRSDRNLFFIWIPLLLVIIIAMLYNRVPQLWSGPAHVLEPTADQKLDETMPQGRIVEV